MEEQRRKQYIKNKNLSGRHKSNHINNNIKCEWIRQFNQKAEIGRIDFLKRSNYTVDNRHTLHSKIQIG